MYFYMNTSKNCISFILCKISVVSSGVLSFLLIKFMIKFVFAALCRVLKAFKNILLSLFFLQCPSSLSNAVNGLAFLVAGNKLAIGFLVFVGLLLVFVGLLQVSLA